jgi:PHD-like zinc-binding domain
VDSKKTSSMTINRLDKKRFRLKCALCSSKGACIECNHGKCRVAAHPWCVLNNPGGFTRRVIKDEDNNLVWEIFCKTHASSVKEPMKPKNKSKMVQQLAAAPIPGSEAAEEKVREKEQKAKKNLDARNALPILSMAHSVRKTSVGGKGVKKPVGPCDESRSQGVDRTSPSSSSLPQNQVQSQASKEDLAAAQKSINAKVSPTVIGRKIRGPYKKKGQVVIKAKENENEDHFEVKIIEKEREKEREKDKGKDKGKETSKSKQITFIDISEERKHVESEGPGSSGPVAAVEAPLPVSAPAQSYSILTLNEWPGQSEGEAMDLDHFWNVASVQYPEDHSGEVRTVSMRDFTSHLCASIDDVLMLEFFVHIR